MLVQHLIPPWGLGHFPGILGTDVPKQHGHHLQEDIVEEITAKLNQSLDVVR